jgi:Fe-S-cluster containining protein
MSLSKENIEKSFLQLKNLYDKIPQTKGCGDGKKCGSYCCEYQTPSMYLSEFLYLWENFLNNSTPEDQSIVILEAIKNYLRNIITKGCVFFDKKAYRCKSHSTRPLACRIYGITNPKSWMSKKKSIKAKYFDVPVQDKKDIDKILDQCDLVSTKNCKKCISVEDENKWFETVKEIEKGIGIDNKTVELQDQPEGTYRSVHDHIMMMLFPEKVLTMLSEERIDRPSEETIELFAKDIYAQLLNQRKDVNP